MCDVRISALLREQQDADLGSMFSERRKRLSYKGNKPPVHWRERLRHWYLDVLQHFAVLWEISGDKPEWHSTGALHLNIMRNKHGRVCLLSNAFKKDLMIEYQNLRGAGVNTCGQLLCGMQVAGKAGPAARISLRGRVNKSHKKVNVNCLKAKRRLSLDRVSRNAQMMQWYNYFMDCRKASAGQFFFSINLDATDVSHKKIMVACFDLPASGISFWAPPLDQHLCACQTYIQHVHHALQCTLYKKHRHYPAYSPTLYMQYSCYGNTLNNQEQNITKQCKQMENQ